MKFCQEISEQKMFARDLGDEAMLRRRENGKYVVLTVRHRRIYCHHKLDEKIYLVN